jgi:YidC/Oxa1 family membrane protein insertase
MTVVWSALESLLHRLDGALAAFPPTRAWSWGAAVVVLTLACRAILLPTLVLQLRFQRRMDALQPEIDAIRDRHGAGLAGLKDDPGGYAANWVRSEDEVGQLLKRNGVRWYAGFLPALVQIPAVVVVLRLLSSDEHTSGLTPSTLSFVPPPTASFLHADRPYPFPAVVAALVAVLVHAGQRRAVAAAPRPPTGVVRQLRLVALPVAAGLLALNLGLAVLVSLLASLVWGLGQATWYAARRHGTTVEQEAART